MKALRFLAPPCLLIAIAACSGDADQMQMSGENYGEAPEDMARGLVLDLTVEDLVALQAEGNIRLIDVRSDEEVADGIIPGAEHIVLDDLAPAELDLSDGREVVFYCRSGRRSANAAMRLSTHLGEPVRHLEGGILAWQGAGQPVTTD